MWYAVVYNTTYMETGLQVCRTSRLITARVYNNIMPGPIIYWWVNFSLFVILRGGPFSLSFSQRTVFFSTIESSREATQANVVRAPLVLIVNVNTQRRRRAELRKITARNYTLPYCSSKCLFPISNRNKSATYTPLLLESPFATVRIE